MLIEAETIPYEPAQLRGERLLVLAPHPDDEVIGCGGLIALHLREHRAVLVVVATDGAEAGDAATRIEESRRGLSRLGEGAQIEFLGFPDRRLDDSAALPLRERLLAFRPDLVLVPSPIEIHPDHLALSRIFCELIQRDDSLFADLAVAQVAFYEVGQPLRPNAIVDITSVSEAKYAAIAQHSSQLELRDYSAYARGLNAYRAMTLPAGTSFAEAYHVVSLPSLRTLSFSALREAAGTPKAIELSAPALPVTVVIRTKDRPALLREAMESVAATGYPCEVVVVNDGGSTGPVLEAVNAARSSSIETRIVNHDTSRGRSAAANAGVEAASRTFVAFLDDDDLFYPEHLAVLTGAAAASNHAGWYSDAVSAFLRPGERGAYETYSRLRLYAHDFDRELLLLDNYVPLPSLLVPRAGILDAGAFDPAFDLFEDWDLLIRLTRRGSLLRIPRVTCEIRHFEGGSSVVLAAPEGSEPFRRAKHQVWTKHAAEIDNEVVAAVLERQKRRLGELQSNAVEARGVASAASRDVDRLLREKEQLIAHAAAIRDQANGALLRVRELEGAVAALSPLAAQSEARAIAIERLQRESSDLREALGRASSESERLGGLLAMIYRSRTWKLHTFLDRLRGRG